MKSRSPQYLVGMGANVWSKVLAGIVAVGLLGLLAAPWLLRFVQERFPAPDATRTWSADASPVDLEPLRRRLPDNLYWRIGAPTKDPQVLRWREEEERHWNGLNRKVLSHTATEEEIREYYGHRRKVSEDLMVFARLVLQEYGAQLPEAERGLYELSLWMHYTRLEELPQQLQSALALQRPFGQPLEGL